jgi:hypothetical protein
MAPGFGSGLAHALTQGLTGYNQGEEENRKQLILLAAQRRQEERQKQQDEIARIGALSQAAQAGLDVAPAVVPDTASRRAVQAENPTSPDGGESSPAIPSQDGTVLGSVGGMTVKVPQGGVVGKAARDDAAKQAQRTADLVRRAQPLNAKLPAGHPYKLSDDQVASIAADPQLYNEWAKGALGITKDPIATHKANRDYDVAHPTRDVGGDNTSWQTVTTGDGSMVQVNPKTGATRPIGLTGRTPGSNARTTAAIQKAVAANQTQLSIIDDALKELGQHESAVGLSRYLGDNINQRLDKGGVAARASIANISSMVVHDRSGAAVTVSEYPRLAPFVPKITDTPATIRTKLAKLKQAVQTETAALQGQPGAQTASPTDPAQALKKKYGLE